MSGYATHEVFNQPSPLQDFNAWVMDAPLRDAVAVFGGAWAQARLEACGARVGTAHVQALARLANRFTPELRTHDRYGHRIDEVEFHPAWHELLGMLRACELAPKWDPSENRFKCLKSKHKQNLRGVPIGANRDPCQALIISCISMGCVSIGRRPASVPVHIWVHHLHQRRAAKGAKLPSANERNRLGAGILGPSFSDGWRCLDLGGGYGRLSFSHRGPKKAFT